MRDETTRPSHWPTSPLCPLLCVCTTRSITGPCIHAAATTENCALPIEHAATPIDRQRARASERASNDLSESARLLVCLSVCLPSITTVALHRHSPILPLSDTHWTPDWLLIMHVGDATHWSFRCLYLLRITVSGDSKCGSIRVCKFLIFILFYDRIGYIQLEVFNDIISQCACITLSSQLHITSVCCFNCLTTDAATKTKVAILMSFAHPVDSLKISIYFVDIAYVPLPNILVIRHRLVVSLWHRHHNTLIIIICQYSVIYAARVFFCEICKQTSF